MSQDIHAAVVSQKGGAFELKQATLGPLRDNEILVEIVATGLCHTDLAVRDGLIPSPLPIVLGHEGAGIVKAIGPAITHVRPGDHVVLTYMSCGQCRECLTGMEASCASAGALCFSGARADGTHALSICGSGCAVHDRFFGQSSFASHAVAHERNVVKIPKEAPLELMGPLGCGIMTGAGAVWNELQAGPGSSIAIFGAGAVGLSAIMAAKVAGATTIVAVDRIPSRLALAKELGATHVFDAQQDDIAEAIRTLTDGGTDFAFDTTGKYPVIRSAVRALRQRGVAAMVAFSSEGDLALDAINMLAGCKTLKGVIEGGGSAQIMIPKLVDLFLAGRFPFDRMVRFYNLEAINDAARDSLEGRTIKPILRTAGMSPPRP